MGAVLIVTSMKYMAAVIPFAIAFLYGLQLFYLRTSRQLRFMDLEAKSPLYTHLLETIQGLSTIRAFGWAPSSLTTGLNFLDISQRPFYLLASIQQWLQLVLSLFVSGIAVLFVGVAVSTTSVSAGSIGLALLNILTLSQSLINIVFVWTELETSLGAISRLREMETNTPKEAKDCEVLVPEASWPQNGKVILENITASYKCASHSKPNMDLRSLTDIFKKCRIRACPPQHLF
jgi:ATP-binding cassette subfamily C (CFTR/MRP) protein 1